MSIFDLVGRDVEMIDFADRYAGIRRLFGLRVDGVEVTQAIQYYRASRHLTDPADRQPDNAVSLVAYKPAWIRVYVRSGLYGGDVAGVTGTVEVQRRHAGFIYLPVTTLSARLRAA